MFSRVTSIGTTLSRQYDLQNLQGELAMLTGEVGSNKKADPSQDLGVGVSILYKLHDDVQQGEAIQNVGTMAGQRLDTMQTAMTSIGTILGETATASLQSTDVGTATTTSLLAIHARDAMASITTLLNTQQDGQSLFGGTDSATTPLRESDAPGGPLTTIKGLLTTAGPQTAATVGVLIAQVSAVFTAKQSSTFSAHVAAASAATDSFQFTYSLNGVPATITSGTGGATDSSEVVLGRLAANINTALGSGVATVTGTGTSATITIDAANATAGSFSFAATTAVSATGALAATPPTGAATPTYQGLFYTSGSTSTDAASHIRIGAGQTLDYNLRGDSQGFKDGMHAMSLLSLLDAKNAAGADLLDTDAKVAVRNAANSLLASAQAEVTAAAGTLGVKQQRLQTIADIQNTAVTAATKQINTLEAPDYYVASDRINALKIQLQATYSLTSTLSGLSLVNYLK